MVTRLRNQAISATISMIFIALVVIDGVLCQQAPTADRRTAQNPNGTFFQPFINGINQGINTFFNPSQFRSPFNRPSAQSPQSPQFVSQQQFGQQPFASQQQPQPPFRGQQQQNTAAAAAPAFSNDFRITRFPGQGAVTSEQQFSFVPQQPATPQQQPAGTPPFITQQQQQNRFQSQVPPSRFQTGFSSGPGSFQSSPSFGGGVPTSFPQTGGSIR